MKAERLADFFLGRDRMGDNTSIRQKGSTTALISIMLANPDAVMLVYSHDHVRRLSKDYNIAESRFINIRSEHWREGRTFTGPVLVDVCAIGALFAEVVREQKDTFELNGQLITKNIELAEELENMKRGTALVELQEQIFILQKANAELLRVNDIQIAKLQKKDLYSQHLRNRNAQLLGAFSKIDAVLAEKLIDPIPEDSL